MKMTDAIQEELYQQSLTEWREFERYQQAQDEYEAQLARVPNRDDFFSDHEYEDALAEWETFTTTLLDRVKELQRTS